MSAEPISEQEECNESTTLAMSAESSGEKGGCKASMSSAMSAEPIREKGERDTLKSKYHIILYIVGTLCILKHIALFAIWIGFHRGKETQETKSEVHSPTAWQAVVENIGICWMVSLQSFLTPIVMGVWA